MTTHLFGSDDCGQREPVTDAFSHGDDVGGDSVRLEAPEVLARAAESRLDLPPHHAGHYIAPHHATAHHITSHHAGHVQRPHGAHCSQQS